MGPKAMIVRFCLYSVLKNFRFFEAFFILFLLADRPIGGIGLTYTQIGLVVGYQKLLTAILEIPGGVLTDRWGRRRALVSCFGCYCVAFVLYAACGLGGWGLTLVLVYVAQTVFGIGEALRTGSHKAIMLDWLELSGGLGQATHVVSLTRFFSKTTSGLSAIAGGGLLYLTGSFVWLFAAASLPAAAGVVLMLSYPRALEGELTRSPHLHGDVSWFGQFRNLWATSGILFLLAQSVVFESQVKLAQHYIQPYLKTGLGAHDITVVGGAGALLIGLYYMVQDVFGGLASICSVSLGRMFGSPMRALRIIYVVTAVVCAALVLSLFGSWLIAGVVGFVLLGALQNARRPLFIAEFNNVMDKPQRATTLSIESLARNAAYGLLAPVTGLTADNYGLPWVMVVIAAVMFAGLLLNLAGKLCTAKGRHSHLFHRQHE